MLPVFDLDATTVLQYLLQPTPAPLLASPPLPATMTPLELPKSSLVLIINNTTSAPVIVTKIELLIPVGQGPGELTGEEQAFQYYFSQSDTYDVTGELSSQSEWQYTIAQANTPFTPIEPGASMYLDIYDIRVNETAGVVPITVNEYIDGGSTANNATLSLTKMPTGWFFDNLVALDKPHGTAVSQVAAGSHVTLQWDTSVVATTPTTFKVIYSTPHGYAKQYPTQMGYWTTLEPITMDTVFTVVAEVYQPNTETYPLYLTTVVSVQNPEIVAGSVTVSGSLSQTNANVTFGAFGNPETVYINENLVVTTGSLPIDDIDGVLIYRPLRQAGANVFFGQVKSLETMYIYENLVVTNQAPPSAISGVMIYRPLTVSGTVKMTGQVNQSGDNVFFGKPSEQETVYVYGNLIVSTEAPPSAFDGVLIYRPLTVSGQVNQSGDNVFFGKVGTPETVYITENLFVSSAAPPSDVNGVRIYRQFYQSTSNAFFGNTGQPETVYIVENLVVTDTAAPSAINGVMIYRPLYVGGQSNQQPANFWGTLKINGDNYGGGYPDATFITGRYVTARNNRSILTPRSDELLLTHAAIVSPESSLAYRGSAFLAKGRAVVQLPSYFEEVADPDSVTIHLTPVDGFDRLCVSTAEGHKVRGGQFIVISDNAASTQAFDWEVRARRIDVPPLVVERSRSQGGPRPESQN